MNTKVNLCGVTLKNPVIMASGTFGAEYAPFYGLGALGGICTKGITLEPRPGNAGPRVYETASGMMNSVGLQNPGARAFIERKLPELLSFGTAVIANVGGSTVEEMAEVVRLLNPTGVAMVELNISCPNVKQGGVAFGVKAATAAAAVRQIKAVCAKPLMVKLSPNAENIGEMAAACAEAGADALSLVNTFSALAIDIERRRPVFENVTAGLSGPAIKPVALRMVYDACRAVRVPVVGLGGIVTAADAVEFIMAGAAAVQVGTANFPDPMAGLRVAEGLSAFMEKQGIQNWAEIRGCISKF